MRKLLVLIMAALLCMASVSAIGGADLKASILRYEPAPAEQGNTVDVWLQLSNRGQAADRVAIKFVPEFPFSLPRGQIERVDVGSVAATEETVVKFTVFIDPDAPNGDRNVTFQYKYGAIDEWAVLEDEIAIQSQDSVLVIDEVKAPELVVPGQIIDVVLKLRNAGRIAIKNLDIAIDLEDGAFSTIGTGIKQRVSRIPAGETEEVTFQLASDTSTEVKLYSLPVSLSYQDERNKQYDETAKFSLVVNAEPEISMTVDDTDFESKSKPGTVSLKVVNKGVVNIKYVTVRLIETPEYKVLSPSNEEYVGNLDSDDFETVDFIIDPKAKLPRLKVKLEFKDPYNVDFTQDYNLPLRILTDKDLGKGGMPVGLIIVVLLIVGGVGYYWWKKKKKKR